MEEDQVYDHDKFDAFARALLGPFDEDDDEADHWAESKPISYVEEPLSPIFRSRSRSPSPPSPPSPIVHQPPLNPPKKRYDLPVPPPKKPRKMKETNPKTASVKRQKDPQCQNEPQIDTNRFWSCLPFVTNQPSVVRVASLIECDALERSGKATYDRYALAFANLFPNIWHERSCISNYFHFKENQCHDLRGQLILKPNSLKGTSVTNRITPKDGTPPRDVVLMTQKESGAKLYFCMIK